MQLRRLLCVMAILGIVCGSLSSARAVMPPPRSPYTPPTKVPAKINGLRYVAGVPAVDNDPSIPLSRPRVWAEFSKKDFALRRQRIDQDTLNSKTRKLEQIDLVRIPYKRIVDVWYGGQALRKLAVTKLQTVPRNIWDSRAQSYEPLEIALEKRNRTPVVVIYEEGRKRQGAFIVMGSHNKSAAVAFLLRRRMPTRRSR